MRQRDLRARLHPNDRGSSRRCLQGFRRDAACLAETQQESSAMWRPEVQMLEPAMSECDVYGALRLGSIPALSGSYIPEQASDQHARPHCVFKVQKEIAGDRKIVTTQNKALNIGFVKLTHFDPQF